MALEKILPIRNAIRRSRADQYILILLLSFAGSVSGTRLFLELTGYPKIGTGNIHIAHVLWGGLILFAATVLPLIFANRWTLTLSALLSGIGVGLFIDEVGKFITANNDYFTPAAAPIVYAFFLVTLLVYTQTKKSEPKDPRSSLYSVLDTMEEVVDKDLSKEEMADMLDRLQKIKIRSDRPELITLATNLEEFLTSSNLTLVIHRPMLMERVSQFWNILEKKYFSQHRTRLLVSLSLIAFGVWSLFSTVGVLLLSRKPDQLQQLITELMNDRVVRNITGMNWFEARISMEGGVGLILLLCGLLILVKKDRPAVNISIFTQIISISVFNLLLFYFDQFSAIINTFFQFIILVLTLRYRKRFLTKKIRQPFEEKIDGR
ncbi:MAG: hypothetical protein HGA86_00570 [Anaerolineaceae bacterium]|nr:hypothetical protein [Anaerolineaceae bacterium]